MFNFKKTMIASAAGLLLSLPGVSSAVGVFQEFTINETSVPGVPADPAYSAVVGDKFSGAYTEIITIGTTPDAGGNLAFETWGYATFSSLYKNDGVDNVDTYLGSASTPGYLLRGLFYSTGLYNTVTNLFTGATATLSLFLDPDKNTSVVFGATAADVPTFLNTGEDYELGTAINPTKLAGIPGTPGAFDFIWNDFLLTSGSAPKDGDSYFIAPRPFHVVLNSNGDFDKPSFGPGTFKLTGDISLVYNVPEPSIVALMGIGLAGIGASMRRKV